MNNIEICFFDIDGTLTNSKQIITNETYKALKYLKTKNIKLVLVSGRWDTYILKFNKDNLFDYIIANNGAEIYDIANNKVIYENKISNDKLLKIDKYCYKNNIKIIYSSKFNLLNNIKDNIYECILICNSIDDIEKIKEFCNINNLKISYISNAYFMKIKKEHYTINLNNIDCSKSNSAKILLKKLDINTANTICFGDNLNDLDLFDICNIKVCMANGINKLKEKATYITKSNDEDGVAYFINKYL